MAMTRTYSRVTHRPAVLFYTPKGKLIALVIGINLGVFAGMNLSTQANAAVTAQEKHESEES